MRKTIWFTDISASKLEEYSKKTHIPQSKIVQLAVEDYIIKKVDIENLTEKEVETRWSAVNEKINQLKILERELLVHLTAY